MNAEQIRHLKLARLGQVDARDVAFLDTPPRPGGQPTMIRGCDGRLVSID
jgi:hypothetical protein